MVPAVAVHVREQDPGDVCGPLAHRRQPGDDPRRRLGQSAVDEGDAAVVVDERERVHQVAADRGDPPHLACDLDGGWSRHVRTSPS
jgi:hypothetical protein